MQLDELGRPDFWKGRAGSDGTLAVVIVLPTGRATETISPHLALSTDGLLLPEITLAVNRLAGLAGIANCVVTSALDIDVCESIDGGATDLELQNLIVVGTADVSSAAGRLLQGVHSYEQWGAGFTTPYDMPAIKGAEGPNAWFTMTGYPNVGLLGMFENPWSDTDRVAILAAGLPPAGTTAAMKLLLDYLEGRGQGNNSFDPNLPFKIVGGRSRIYTHVGVKNPAECRPPMEVANIAKFEIHE